MFRFRFPFRFFALTSFCVLGISACAPQNGPLPSGAAAQGVAFATAPRPGKSGASLPVAAGELPVGFASIEALGQNGTTGGSGGPTVRVSTAREFQSAVERLDVRDKAARDQTPRIILVGADIDLGELGNEPGGMVLKAVGRVRVRPNTTILGAGDGPTLRHGILEVKGAHNVVICNLKFRDLWEEDPSGAYDELGWDFVRITDGGGVRSHHIWVDHCDFGRVYDGMIDITHGSDLVTISWNRFAGQPGAPQKKAMLIGHSSSEKAAAMDRGRLNVTLHHNLFLNIDDRAPRARFGNIHVWNQVVEGAKNATMSVSGAVTLVENSVYRDTQIATSYSHDKDSVAQNRGGAICLVNSRNQAPRPLKSSDDADKQFEIAHNFQSSAAREKLQFNAPADWKWPHRNRLPYAYTPDATERVVALVEAGAGTFRAKH